MHNTCTNMQNQYASICIFKIYINMCFICTRMRICWNMHKDKYAIICQFKYAYIGTKYAQICKNMQ